MNSTVAGSILRTDDLRHSMAVRLYDRERNLGGYVSWLRAFGPKIRSSRRRYGLGTALGISWLKPVADSPEGVGVTMSLALADSTTVSSTNPRSGHLITVGAGPVLAIHDETTSLGAFAAFQGFLTYRAELMALD